jgi:adenylate kinase
MLNIVLFGPPGAGKGTQADFLIKNYQLIHLSTGDLLRGEIAAKTELGLKAKTLMDKGELVPDEVVIGMIESKLKADKDAKGFIFDGFPRTVAQAKALDNLLNGFGHPVSGMLALEVKKQELINRLLERGKVSGRSDDQDASIIENRINVYNEKTMPLIDFYQKQNKFYPIEGMGTIEEIARRIEAVVKKLMSQQPLAKGQ